MIDQGTVIQAFQSKLAEYAETEDELRELCPLEMDRLRLAMENGDEDAREEFESSFSVAEQLLWPSDSAWHYQLGKPTPYWKEPDRRKNNGPRHHYSTWEKPRRSHPKPERIKPFKVDRTVPAEPPADYRPIYGPDYPGESVMRWWAANLHQRPTEQPAPHRVYLGGREIDPSDLSVNAPPINQKPPLTDDEMAALRARYTDELAEAGKMINALRERLAK